VLTNQNQQDGRNIPLQQEELTLSIQPKLFLTCAAVCILPLLIIAIIGFRYGLKNTESLLWTTVQDDSNDIVGRYSGLIEQRQHELQTLTRGALPAYIRATRNDEDTATALVNARKAITELPYSGLYYAQLACFDAGKNYLFLVDPVNDSPNLRTKDIVPRTLEPDERVWNAKSDAALCLTVAHPAIGTVVRCSIPVFLTDDKSPGSLRGALVADIKADRLLESASGPVNSGAARSVIVVDDSGKVVYHANEVLRNQVIERAEPLLASRVRALLTNSATGIDWYRAQDRQQWLAAYGPLAPGLFLIVARNYSEASGPARLAGWTAIAIAILLGLGVALLLAQQFEKKTQQLERVSRSVAAIAGGNLDQRVEARSSDDLRPLADSVNLMTDQLREQIRRETETRQFDSFVRLSAMLTHDLKNAIEALSLIVGNMERHFDNPRFRAETMTALTGATEKLKGLVTRLSHPVDTLSGEFKLPRPVDVSVMLQRVIQQTANSLKETHEIVTKLPPAVFALADGERLEKVMENLTINALEAMAGRSGKLTIESGHSGQGKVFFRVTDTGDGMSPDFIKERLFRPFATTKRSGVGLGLYTCREVIRANGGSIEVESQEGSGTTFLVVLASAANQGKRSTSEN